MNTEKQPIITPDPKSECQRQMAKDTETERRAGKLPGQKDTQLITRSCHLYAWGVKVKGGVQ